MISQAFLCSVPNAYIAWSALHTKTCLTCKSSLHILIKTIELSPKTPQNGHKQPCLSRFFNTLFTWVPLNSNKIDFSRRPVPSLENTTYFLLSLSNPTVPAGGIHCNNMSFLRHRPLSWFHGGTRRSHEPKDHRGMVGQAVSHCGSWFPTPWNGALHILQLLMVLAEATSTCGVENMLKKSILGDDCFRLFWRGKARIWL